MYLSKSRTVRVVAAVIEREGKILIGQRKEPGARKGKWEFPGGKVRPGESEEAALIREIQEEHGVQAIVEKYLSEVIHDYGDLFVHVRFYRCRIEPGAQASCRDHQAIAWVTPKEMSDYDFLEADLPFIRELQKN